MRPSRDGKSFLFSSSVSVFEVIQSKLQSSLGFLVDTLSSCAYFIAVFKRLCCFGISASNVAQVFCVFWEIQSTRSGIVLICQITFLCINAKLKSSSFGICSIFFRQNSWSIRIMTSVPGLCLPAKVKGDCLFPVFSKSRELCQLYVLIHCTQL